MRRKSRSLSLGVLSAVLLMAISVPAQATKSKADVFTFFNADGTPAAGDVVGKATLKRSKEGVNLTVHTSNLDPGNAYTIWWVIFNNPGACSPAGCSDSDFPTADVEASVMHATGRVADSDGNSRLSAFLPVGYMHTNPSSGNGRQLFGPGLQNLKGAEIHIVIRCHGPSNGPFGDTEQLSTFFGDCINDEGDDICFDAQAAVFPLPRSNDEDSDSD